MRSIFILLLGLLLLTPRPSLAERSPSVVDGPIELRDQHPISLLHSTFRPQDTSILAPGGIRLNNMLSVSNTLNTKPNVYRIDTETRVSDLFIRYGLAPQIELQLSQNIIWRGAGESDELISAFHRAFQIDQARSELVPEDDYRFSGVNDDGTTFEFRRNGIGLSGLETALKYSPSQPDAATSWAVTFGLGLPTGTSEFAQNGLDLQLGLYGEHALGRVNLYSGGALLYFTDTEVNNLQFPSLQYSGFLGMGIPLNGDFSLYLGAHLASMLLDNFVVYPDYQTYVDVGIRTRVTDTLTIDTALRENILHSQGTTDLTLTFGVTYQPCLQARDYR